DCLPPLSSSRTPPPPPPFPYTTLFRSNSCCHFSIMVPRLALDKETARACGDQKLCTIHTAPAANPQTPASPSPHSRTHHPAPKRSEEHTSELPSREKPLCRPMSAKKKK